MSQSSYHGQNFDQHDFSGRDLSHAQFVNCSFRRANLSGVNFEAADLRGSDFRGANLKGANFHYARLDGANLTDIITDQDTRWLKSYCPEQGAFLGYKKAYNHLMIQLLIPADALRSSATSNACRCSKAKVLAIYDPKTYQRHQEAQSLADPDFIYRVGEWVVPDHYTLDRFVDSTHGLHFWMSRAEAMNYL